MKVSKVVERSQQNNFHITVLLKENERKSKYFLDKHKLTEH